MKYKLENCFFADNIVCFLRLIDKDQHQSFTSFTNKYFSENLLIDGKKVANL